MSGILRIMVEFLIVWVKFMAILYLKKKRKKLKN